MMSQATACLRVISQTTCTACIFVLFGFLVNKIYTGSRLCLSLVERLAGLEDERHSRPPPVLDEQHTRRESWGVRVVRHSGIYQGKARQKASTAGGARSEGLERWRSQYKNRDVILCCVENALHVSVTRRT